MLCTLLQAFTHVSQFPPDRTTSSFASDDEDDPIASKPVPRDVYDVIAKEAEKRREMEKREAETPLRRKDSSEGGGKIGWGSNTNLTEVRGIRRLGNLKFMSFLLSYEPTCISLHSLFRLGSHPVCSPLFHVMCLIFLG